MSESVDGDEEEEGGKRVRLWLIYMFEYYGVHARRLPLRVTNPPSLPCLPPTYLRLPLIDQMTYDI